MTVSSSLDSLAVSEIRKLVVDCCRQHGGGHGGSAVGMAPLAVALWRHVLRYNPRSPSWAARDRFVLSNGHAAILLYSVLHIAGYEQFSMDQLRGYGHPKPFGYETHCFAHPEIEFDGVEITTGPLGQGIANAVGLAIAQKQLAATYARPAFENLVPSRIFCASGDGCLMEGVALEAMALAGNFGLDNLILLYDNNEVTCDGPLSWIVTEGTNAKIRAMGWRIINVFDGDTDVSVLVNAIEIAKTYSGKPTMINIRTTIGFGTDKAGTAGAHHGTFSDADVERLTDGTDRPTHYVLPAVYEYFSEAGRRGAGLQQEWEHIIDEYSVAYPNEARELCSRLSGKPIDYRSLLADITIPDTIQAAREINGYVFRALFNKVPSMFAGGADLWGANKLGADHHVIFGPGSYEGRIARYGIREHAMAAISNGISAFQPGAFIPITATFLMFYLYAAPGVRMGALNSLQVIHVATHDSFQEGQNGPTHQPVELDSLLRAMPNFLYMRPSSAEEIIGCWEVALREQKTSTMISVARDPAVYPPQGTCREKTLLGGYILEERADAVVTLVSRGSALGYAQAAAETLTAAHRIACRVVSIPCISLFEAQSEQYKQRVLGSARRIVSVEEYVPTVWARLCTASIGMDSFGYSASGPNNYGRFGLDVEGIVGKVSRYVAESEIRHWQQL
ncbi:Transketolase, thiamine diphosphate binding domain-containing protein [Myxozyma melibiosi]|uniref:Transketolase, thiamine diphosphate binding domain-containing protein n=1 Tax=Myxozyma melibiosi TaxID=54550 RepID=A0ABR1EZT9_9ASCO